ncbi:MAG: amidohydrolase family protein [Rectinemataceae bacterium]
MLIANVLAALPGEEEFRKVDILIKGEKIVRIVAAGSPDAEETIHADGLMMFPGAIDPHVHFDEPGFTHREDFLHGSSEAARGGVTTVIDMPCTSLPPVTSLAALESKLAIVSKKAVVDFAFFGGVNGLAEGAGIAEAIASLAPWVVGFKCYTISGMDTFTAVDREQFAFACARCAEVGRPLLLHAEDPAVIAEAQKRRAAARGSAAPTWKDYYASRPMEAEIEACRKAVESAGEAASTLHVVHVGTAEAAAIVAGAGGSCETCAHYLAFDEEDFERLGPALKTAPPVKGPAQKALLWKQLAGGEISFVTSDHAGAPVYEKFTGDPLTAYGGIPGTGTLFPYLLSEGLFARRLGLHRFLEATSGAAARRYGISGGKGSLEPGKDADFVLVDPKAKSIVDPSIMFSKSRITPFAGMPLSGRIIATFVRGKRVFDLSRAAILVPPGSGKFIKWGYR